MKVGFNLLLWTTHVVDEHLPLFETLKRTGYDGVEIPIFEGAVAEYQRLGRVIRATGLACTSVTVIPDEARNPISADPAYRRAAADYLAWAVECSAALGSETLVGPYHSPLGVFTGHGPTADEQGWAADAHRKAAERAATMKVGLAVEYLNRFECYFLNTMADAVAHVRRVDHPNFGTMYDSFHANIEEKDPVGCIGAAARTLRHVHISENDRGTPGKGHLAWPEIFAAIRRTGYDGWLTIEAFSRALPDLAAATRVWRDFFPSREEGYGEGLPFIRNQWAAAA